MFSVDKQNCTYQTPMWIFEKLLQGIKNTRKNINESEKTIKLRLKIELKLKIWYIINVQHCIMEM